MNISRRHVTMALALAAVLVVASPRATSAAGTARASRPSPTQSDSRYSPYDNGYRMGFDRGRDDATDDRAFDYAENREYRTADMGYRRGYGDMEWYRQEFRRGYAAGYTRRYGEFAPEDRAIPDDHVVPEAVPRYAYEPGYMEGSVGFNRGYTDGFDKGVDDARHHHAYEPTRLGMYRAADHGYERDYGPRGSYEMAYRQGFLRGYAEGYRGTGDDRR